MKVTSTELKLRLGKYLKESFRDPVIISVRGNEENVLLSLHEYEKLKFLEKHEQVKKD